MVNFNDFNLVILAFEAIHLAVDWKIDVVGASKTSLLVEDQLHSVS